MRTFGNRLRAIVVILAGIALILGTSACSWFDSRQTNEPTPNGSTTPASKITVVATLNQWGSLAKQIGGNQVEVSSILSPTPPTHIPSTRMPNRSPRCARPKCC